MKRSGSDSDLSARKLSVRIMRQGDQMWVVPPPQGQVQNIPQVPPQNVVPPPQVPPQNVPPQGQVQNIPQVPPQNVVPPPQGQVQNAPSVVLDRGEMFDIVCFYVGQGDCSMIRCPDGRIVMIDCGSKYDLSDDSLRIIVNMVRHPGWGGGRMCIDALILTHSDADHHNKVKKVLHESSFNILDPNTQTGAYTDHNDKMKIDKIYFSCPGGDTGPLAHYGGDAFNQEIYNHTFETSEIQTVTISSNVDTNNYYKKWDAVGGFVQIVPNPTSVDNIWPITNRKHTILSGRTVGGKNWSVSLIAGNIDKIPGPIAFLGQDEDGKAFKDTVSADNAQSLITLFEIDGKKALFCGDATFSTESFLVQYQSVLISNVDFLLAPHHGSEFASSIPFVNATNPKAVAVSVGFMEHSHKHPRKNSVLRWVAKLPAGAEEREIDYWDTGEANAQRVWDDWETRYGGYNPGLIYNWNSQNQIQFNNASFFWLQATPKDQYYGLKRGTGGWQGALYREWVTRDIRETPFAIDPQNPHLPQTLRYKVG